MEHDVLPVPEQTHTPPRELKHRLTEFARHRKSLVYGLTLACLAGAAFSATPPSITPIGWAVVDQILFENSGPINVTGTGSRFLVVAAHVPEQNLAVDESERTQALRVFSQAAPATTAGP